MPCSDRISFRSFVRFRSEGRPLSPSKRTFPPRISSSEMCQQQPCPSDPGPTFDPVHSDTEMATHKFRVGERAQFLAGAAVRFATAEVYEIVQQLPESDGEYQYKIKSADDPHLRVAKKASFAERRFARWKYALHRPSIRSPKMIAPWRSIKSQSRQHR